MAINIKSGVKQLFAKGETARFQALCILLTATFVGIFFYGRLHEPAIFLDTAPQINQYSPDQLTAAAHEHTIVKTGLSIKNFSVFDMLTNRFVCDAIVWFEYNPKYISRDNIEQFSFQKGAIIEKSAAQMEQFGDMVRARYTIRLEFTTLLDHHFFPFDDHKIYLILTNEFVSSKQMLYVAEPSNFTLASDLLTSGYQYLGRTVHYGNVQSLIHDAHQYETNPAVVFAIELGKTGMRKPILIIIPLIVMLFVSLFALTRNPLEEKALVLRVVVAALPAIIAYRFVIEAMTPKVNYSTIADYLFSYVLMISFFVFVIASYYASKGTTRINERIVRRSFIFLSYVLLIIMIYYLFFIWYR